MYELVADVESYPRFLPWCEGSSVDERHETVEVATIQIVCGPLRKTFTTRNQMTKYQRIDMDLIDGPFSHLRGAWSFEAVRQSGCKVSLDLEFEFSNSIIRSVVTPAFNAIAGSMVDAFTKRAHLVYGSR
jgi:ribosome-associated toxin RatA of RatAB toxin-antitoxin module